jgi:hypothetical protein
MRRVADLNGLIRRSGREWCLRVSKGWSASTVSRKWGKNWEKSVRRDHRRFGACTYSRQKDLYRTALSLAAQTHPGQNPALLVSSFSFEQSNRPPLPQ